jgi:glucose-1-phosphate cytidylyltransferase
MKVVILAGGFGTRLSEETVIKPKPMVEIGHKPILWHIMKYYSHYGFNEFVIALGYKAEFVKDYFLNYQKLDSDLFIDFSSKEIKQKKLNNEKWKIHLIDTGINTLTGGRINRLRSLIDKETFLLTYGDGVSDVNIKELIKFHKKQKDSIVTLTAVHPPARFGGIKFSHNRVKSFAEKSQVEEGWINGGFMVVEPEIFNYINNDQNIFESDVLESVAKNNELTAYKHNGFWQCMDALRDKYLLDSLWKKNEAPWRVWK